MRKQGVSLREKEFGIFEKGGLVEEFRLESWEGTFLESHFLKGSLLRFLPDVIGHALFEVWKTLPGPLTSAVVFCLPSWPRSCKRSFTSSPQPLWPSFHLSYAPSLKLGHQLGWDSSLFFSSYEIYTLSTYLNYICVCLCIIYKTIYKYTHTYIHFISQAL